MCCMALERLPYNRELQATPRGKTIDHKGHLRIAQLLQSLPCQGSTAITPSMQDDIGGFVWNNVLNAEFQQAAR